MLRNATVLPMLPVKDMPAAMRFYENTLGLEKTGGAADVAVTYRSGGSTLCVYRSEFAGTNKGTAALWEVDDVEGTAKELKSKGVTFETYDLPGLIREGDIYRAGDFRVVWFKDPAGNILSIQNRPGARRS
jgi:predicted enzyme related to lactoylglutathione lyase